MRTLHKLGQTGDTIVEVLISTAVIGMVLGVSYSTASRSLRLGQQSQERGEALKLVESTLEELKYISSTPSAVTTIFAQPAGQAFCIRTANPVSLNSITGYNAVLASDNFAGYASGATNCTFASSGASGGRYNIAILYNQANNDTFTVTARWDSLNSDSGRDEVKMSYRLHHT